MYAAHLFDRERTGPSVDGVVLLADMRARVAAMTRDELGDFVVELQARLNTLSALQAVAVAVAARRGLPAADRPAGPDRRQ